MRKIITILLLGILLTGCSITGKRKGGLLTDKVFIDSERFYDELKDDNLCSAGFYISRADIGVNTPALNIKLIATVKYKYPDSLFISLRTRSGIEAGRLLITDDTVLVNDRINRKIYYGDPKDIEKKYEVSSKEVFALFGDFIGKPVRNGNSVKCIDGLHYCETILEEYRLKYEIDCYIKKPYRTLITGPDESEIEAFFTDFSKHGAKMVANSIKVTLDSGKGNFTADIKNIETNWVGDIGFKTGRNYRNVRIK